MDEKLYWLAFSQFPGVGPGRFAKLLKHFGSAKDAWAGSETELEEVLGKALLEKFLDFRKKFSISDYEKRLQKARVYYSTLNDENYPELLKQIKNPPFVLFYKARLDSRQARQGKFLFNTPANMTTIGIVGTRKITDYGRQVTELITSELVAGGCVIVSGLALGVDAVAHQTTIDNQGKTIAVLGSGIDLPYPRENENLYNEIVDSGGVIVSEYGLGQLPTIGSFPSRNRIIAGLSQGVVVTEGAADSGALITASDATLLHRKVFAVPGPVTSSLSKGPYALIKKGAVVVGSGKEILEELNVKSTMSKNITSTTKVKGETKEEQLVLNLLAEQALHFDELVKKTKINSSKLGTILSIMEMKGMIRSLSAGFFSLD